MTAIDRGPNAALIDQPGSRRRLTTPALVLDLDGLERNMTTLARLCADAGVAIRPHAKTHKSSAIARRQRAGGALGVCCASLREAEAMVAGDIAGVHITSPVVGPAKLARLTALAHRAPDLTVVVDNPAHVDALAAAMGGTTGGASARLGVIVDIDPGMGRTGVAEADQAVALALAIDAADGLDYRGIQAYSGLVQHIEVYEERRGTYAKHLDRLRTIQAALTAAGHAPAIVTGGGTGSLTLDHEAQLFTEIQAGSYVFMDVQYNAVQLARDKTQLFETALTVRCTVVSANAPGFVTIDGGYKSFSADGPLPEIARGPHAGAPAGSRYQLFGDEHGKVVFADTDDRLAIGDHVELITPHCDPTINMHDRYHCVRGDTLVDIWPIDARGVL